jgi:hypothetical protein
LELEARIRRGKEAEANIIVVYLNGYSTKAV